MMVASRGQATAWRRSKHPPSPVPVPGLSPVHPLASPTLVYRRSTFEAKAPASHAYRGLGHAAHGGAVPRPVRPEQGLSAHRRRHQTGEGGGHRRDAWRCRRCADVTRRALLELSSHSMWDPSHSYGGHGPSRLADRLQSSSTCLRSYPGPTCRSFRAPGPRIRRTASWRRLFGTVLPIPMARRKLPTTPDDAPFPMPGNQPPPRTLDLTVTRHARVCVVVPAFNEEHSVGAVVRDLRLSLPGAQVVVVDDGSTDETTAAAAQAGAAVVTLPVNLGIGGAVQAGYRYALRHDFHFAMQVDGDGQHDPSEAVRLLDPVVRDQADLTLGSRWLGRGDYVANRRRRLAMRLLARMVRWQTGGVFTDTTSGFRALGPATLELFARSYPTDFPEVESIVLASRAGLRVKEIPIKMTERKHGHSSIAGIRGLYYMIRVALALLLCGPDREPRS